MKRILVLLFMAAFLVFSCGCTGVSPSPPATQSATPAPTPIVTTAKPTTPAHQPTSLVTAEITPSEPDITIINNRLSQPDITVGVGSTVRWSNEDTGTAHRIQFADRQFQSPLISSGQSFSQKFDTPGVYPYTCLVQMNEPGTVTVV